MVGRNLEDLYGQPGENRTVEPVMKIIGLKQAGVLHDISFEIRAGEILGVAGLVGSGRSEMARAIFGADRSDSGEVWVAGKKHRIRSPREAIRAGIGLLPEDRKLQGLFLSKAIRENITAASLTGISRYGFIRRKNEKNLSKKFVSQMNIRTPSIEQQARNLSGGNQQKVVLAKWMAVNPKVLFLDEPTRGVDIGAKMEIYTLMRDMAQQGMAVVMISSELPEILGMSDRIIVIREGHLVGELSREAATEGKIMAMATGLAMEAGQ
jgi:ribose transport system ATP-binding protein